ELFYRCSLWCSVTSSCVVFTWDKVSLECKLYSSLNVITTTPSLTTTLLIYGLEVPTSEWISHSAGFYYQILHFSGIWADGRDYCVSLGGKLGYYNDALELKTMRSLAGVNGMYVGLSRMNDSSLWYDEDGTQYPTLPWSQTATEPDPGEHCAAFYGGALSNVRCEGSRDINVLCFKA
ncbi:putative Lectin C-type domain-containing protein 3, partial [Homarus americanus]